MCLLLRDKLTTKPPHWKRNESISDAGQQSESCSLRPHTQTIHTASSPRYHSHSPTKTRLWALSGTRGVRTATPPDPPPLYLLVHTRVSLDIYSTDISCG